MLKQRTSVGNIQYNALLSRACTNIVIFIVNQSMLCESIGILRILYLRNTYTYLIRILYVLRTRCLHNGVIGRRLQVFIISRARSFAPNPSSFQVPSPLFAFLEHLLRSWFSIQKALSKHSITEFRTQPFYALR